jgi:hypothetical protein
MTTRGDDGGDDPGGDVAVGRCGVSRADGRGGDRGLTLSTVLTLLIVPAAFSLADGFEKGSGRNCGVGF